MRHWRQRNARIEAKTLVKSLSTSALIAPNGSWANRFPSITSSPGEPSMACPWKKPGDDFSFLLTNCKCSVVRAMESKVHKTKKLPRGKTGMAPPLAGYTEEEWNSFSRSKRWRLRYPDRQKAANAASIAKNPTRYATRHRKYLLAREYGLTENDYARMLQEQNGCCAVCGTDKPTGRWKAFAVDHNHTTGKVRALLCNECNRGIGLLKDNATLLRKAADYLDLHS